MLAIADLVDADYAQAVEAAVAVPLLLDHPVDEVAHGAPGDAEVLGHSAEIATLGQPGHLLLEGSYAGARSCQGFPSAPPLLAIPIQATPLGGNIRLGRPIRDDIDDLVAGVMRTQRPVRAPKVLFSTSRTLRRSRR